MAVVVAQSGSATILGAAQTGNVDTTSTLDRGLNRGSAAIVLASTAGGGGTVKVDISGSVDGTNFYNVPYALVATPETAVVTQITVISTTTVTYLLRPDHAWRYLKLVYSSNTAMTMTATAYL